MLNSLMIGAYISKLRKDQDMTQAELADRLNVSHQAVSKWERGESLPDIGTFPRLAQLFGTSVDNLLNAGESDTNQEHPPIEEHTALNADNREQAAEDFREPIGSNRYQVPEKPGDPIIANLNTEEPGESFATNPEHTVVELEAPTAARLEHTAVKPTEINAINPEPAAVNNFSEQSSANQEDPTAETAPSERSEAGAIESLTKQQFSFEAIKRLAPYLGAETLDELIRHAENGEVHWDIVSSLAPFISKETIVRLVNKAIEGTFDVQQIVKIAPFLGKDQVDRLVEQAEKDNLSWKTVHSLAPFISQETLDRLVSRVVDGDLDADRIVKLAPFLGREQLDRLVEQAEAGGLSWSTIQSLAPFISRDTLNRLVDRVVDGNLEVERIIKLAPFLDKESLEKLVHMATEEQFNPDLLAKLAPFINRETLNRLVTGLINKLS